MSKNPLLDLETHGQSIWLDFISRELLESGQLHRLIKEDHLKGLTSNPSIFEKAITQTDDYRAAIDIIGEEDPHNAKIVYESIAIKDIQDAADFLRPVYEENQGLDGFVSLEVSPHLAFDSDGTIEEGRRLWHQVDRPNLMIKVPGTKKGMGAIRELISLGINVNVTLLFSVDAYKEAAMAYLWGLKDRAEKGLPINSVQSVASFFVSRIDTKIDDRLAQIAKENSDPKKVLLAKSLQGKIAIANAKVAYSLFEEIYQSELAKSLIRQGAHPQRLLWASTGTKNKNYSDILYVESLVGKHTVNTLPPATLDAFRDHGKVSSSIKDDISKAKSAFKDLESLGIDFKSACEELVSEGVKLFSDSFDHLLGAMEQKLQEVAASKPEKKN